MRPTLAFAILMASTPSRNMPAARAGFLVLGDMRNRALREKCSIAAECDTPATNRASNPGRPTPILVMEGNYAVGVT